MTDEHARINLLDFNRQGMENFFAEKGEKPFRASQLLKWIYHEGVYDFDQMTNISKVMRAELQQQAEIRMPECIEEHPSADGTIKWLLRVDSGNAIETVYIPEGDRATLCVSSQVGCTLNCTFCSTATQGFNRNLSTAEIVGQILFATDRIGRKENRGEHVITNVVLMGMGEPLMNFDNVMRAIDVMTEDFGFGISKRKVTLSTSGVVPALDRMREFTDVSLAVSLHAPNDELRDKLVPINRKYPIKVLLDACRRYVEGKQRRRVTFEYVMLDGVNDRPEHASQLIRLLKTVPAKLNLIPFNPYPGSSYRCSSEQTMEYFRSRVNGAGIVTIIRKTRGNDVDAACGQLVGNIKDRTRRSQRMGHNQNYKQGQMQVKLKERHI
ncbi:MAG TPA: 23S rRNA (adenine(2503)-C(2))-methyltransferase RlmN [Gammaproteobacteria bacterium]|nr:23S rRNA (adenine(2503)-C(2))-methyltransferase RlmN [Gammaproteobacteria bacterium]